VSRGAEVFRAQVSASRERIEETPIMRD
jgi:hypothetical protein